MRVGVGDAEIRFNKDPRHRYAHFTSAILTRFLIAFLPPNELQLCHRVLVGRLGGWKRFRDGLEMGGTMSNLPPKLQLTSKLRIQNSLFHISAIDEMSQ